jgi:hypothetical protein
VGSVCELLFPVILILLIVLIRNIVSNEDYGVQSYLAQPGGAYYYNETTKASTTTSTDKALLNMGFMPGLPFSICFGYNRPLIAFVGSSKLYPKLKDDLFGQTGGNRKL